MTDQWYFGRGSDISGPVSGPELADMAASGRVIPSDMLWREGEEVGFSAGTVTDLFAAPAIGSPSSSPAEPNPESVNTLSAGEAGDGASSATSAGGEPAPNQRTASARAARATAGKGTVIIGQDGKTVKFRMKCLACGKEDSSWKSVPIPRGTTRSSFFCPKCRKRQDVEIHGIH